MWIDKDGTVHTVWVPPHKILGDTAVATLAQVPPELAEQTAHELGDAYDQVQASAVAEGPELTGPTDLADVDEAHIPYPPELGGLAPTAGEPLTATVLSYVGRLPAQWRLEALEAVIDVLVPEMDDDEVDRYFSEHADDTERE